jgi:hypothetical protein
MSLHQEFSDAALTELLRALRARSASRPGGPGLIASLPAVRQDRMPAACAELVRRGHSVQRVSATLGRPESWMIGLPTERS